MLLSLLSTGSSPLVSLLGNGELDTLALGERDLSLGTLTNDENVRESGVSMITTRRTGYSPGSKGSVEDISDVDNVESTEVSLLVNDNTRSTHVSSTSDHDDVSWLELDVVDDFVLNKVEFDSVVDLDSWVGVSDGSSVVGDNVWDTLGTELMSLDFAEFEVGLLG